MPHTIFDLHEQVLAAYRNFVRSFLLIADERAQAFVNRVLQEETHLWPDFLVQVSPTYATGPTVDDLAREGLITPQTATIFRKEDGQPFRLYRHQEEAIRKALAGESYVVTSGTGSGKSLCYFLPIVDSLIRQPNTGDRVAALVVYLMNALVNSQLQALERLKAQYERQTGQPLPVTFHRYTGETTEGEREKMRQHPPQILLTNYVMGELLLVRPEDQRFLDGTGGGLRFLVFDELHTYRGRQGADVAMLVRRLKERCAGPHLIHVGTSATMVAHPDATPEERRRSVAEFASRFFGHPFQTEQIIEETLSLFTEGGPPSAEELAAAFTDPLPEDVEAFRRHALVRWVEYEFGVQAEQDGRFKRRMPRTLPEVAKLLAEQTGESDALCQQRLREVFALGGRLGTSDGGRALAFKLHQFIGQGRTLYATLEAADQREFSVEGQIHTADGKLFAPIKFCRQCGQDYYHVVRFAEEVLPHPESSEVTDEGGRPGYLMLAPSENDWSEEQIPDEWRDSKGRLSPTWRDRVPQPVWVLPHGRLSSEETPNTQKMWWQPEPFSLCLNCGEFYTGHEREFAKLASLSSEGRSSATTVLAASLLRHASRTEAARDKLLTFTDNRQDASLQAGHFNDFVQVALLRSALYAALAKRPQLGFDEVASAVVAECGLTIRDIARNPKLDPNSAAADDVWKVFTELTEYRLYEDLRRGWRVVQPNLEHVGLLRIAYKGQEELCHNDSLWSFDPKAKALSPEQRQDLVRTVLDHFRRKLAIDTKVLQEPSQLQLRRRAEQKACPRQTRRSAPSIEPLAPAGSRPRRRRFLPLPLLGQRGIPPGL